MKKYSTLSLALLPQPQSLKPSKGCYRIPSAGTIGITDGTLFSVADQAKSLFTHHSINIMSPGLPDSLSIRLGTRLKPGGYSLSITPTGVSLAADSVSASFHALQTLNQIARQSRPGTLPCLQIDDWPDFADRGVYYDVCRGRVPKLDQLLQMVDQLAHYKINHFQLYIEHTFLFRGHPDIGKEASPLTAEDILTLDRHCRERHIELVPSLASFGHLATVLKHPQYHALAETAAHHSLSPANPQTYTFLDSLFSEFLPLFSSKRFNVCCDEVMDLGNGQSSALCKKKGKGEVYLSHIVKLSHLARQYGKQIMFWGDIIRHYPDLIKKIPQDVTVLDWGYDYNHLG
jgi:N-acetyl-beta-hexosaminidase